MLSTGNDGLGQEAAAAPKASGFAAPAVNLPKGGGAIRGIGEKFSANPVTGTGSLVVPLATSPGRSGFGPALSLTYDSGAGNGPFGFGWQLDLPSIARKTDKGLPRYTEGENADTFILSGAEDLVPELKADQNGIPQIQEHEVDGYRVRRYRPRIEGLFARIERWSRIGDPSDVHWRSISKDNILTLYGADANSRIADPAGGPPRIFAWLMCETRDDKGNGVLYRYKAEDGAGVDIGLCSEFNRGKTTAPDRTANRYLKHIYYGNRVSLLDANGDRPRALDRARIDQQISSGLWMFEVVFDYGEHADGAPAPGDTGAWGFRLDPFSTRRPGFEVRTTRLCRRMLMFHHFDGENGVGRDCLVRSTDFAYVRPATPAVEGGPAYSFLQSVSQCGYRRQGDGYLKRSLPKLEFEYQQPVVQEKIGSLDATSLRHLPEGIDGERYRWVDLHGEGIAGILSEQPGAWYYRSNLSPLAGGAAQFAPMEQVALRPEVALTRGTAHFMDLAGDGLPDLVVLDDPVPGFYEHDAAEGWENFRPFTERLNRDFRDPNLRFIDLDGDGHADVLITEGDALIWHPSLAESGFGPARRVGLDLDEQRAPQLVFSDPAATIYLADMTGDGLTDLVRITEREVCYWPNLGHGHFGAKITMDQAPDLGDDGAFDTARILLADIDGSGTADIIHLHASGIRLYFNLSGNAWSRRHPFKLPLRVDDAVTVAPLDLFGNGTACLVWSSPLPGDAAAPLRYIDLMGNAKPHLLTRVVNKLGAETRIHYAPSTRFYLSDKRDGKPWLTRLPFPVQVVDQVETFDAVSRSRFVTRRAYHHGYFDGEEREFRGFGMVEQWDTETFAALAASGDLPQGDNVSAESHVPPVHTKTWFHTGAYLGADRVEPALAGLLDLRDRHGYFREPGLTHGEAEALMLGDHVLPAELAADEAREAYRALKGVMLRQEIFADDASPRQEFPYLVTIGNQTVRRLQPRGKNQHAVFMTHARETLSYHYERNPADPRIRHSLNLEVDAFGNILKQAEIAYGRRATIRVVDDDGTVRRIDNPGQSELTAWDIDRQTRPLLTYMEARATNGIEELHHYRAPLPCETCSYELTGYAPTGPAGRFFATDIVEPDPDAGARLRHRFAEELAYEASSDLPLRRRPVERQRILWRSDDLTGLLPLGQLPRLALPGETYSDAFTPGLLNAVFVRSRKGQPPEPLLSDAAAVLSGMGGGGYVSGQALRADGRFPADDTVEHWWLPSGRLFLSPDAADGPAAERAHATNHFFLPYRFVDPFGQTTTLAYDSHATLQRNHNLLPVRLEDPLENVISAVNDYRVLQPLSLTDPNGNRTEVRFDVLGLVVGTAVMGKAAPATPEGDSFTDFTADPDPDALRAFFDAADPRPLARAHLGTASTRILYDLSRVPSCAVTIARETHVSDLGPGQESRLQLSFGYSDGFGREAGKKLQAEPGPVPQRGADGNIIVGPDGLPQMGDAVVSPRWVGSGWTVFNNKGAPVRQYEPFFTDTHRREADLRIGVSPVIFYDPLQRVIGTLHADHTWEKVVFDPWQQVTHDASDTLLAPVAGAGPTDDPDLGDYVARLPQAAYLPTWHALRADPAHAAALALRYPDAADRANETAAAASAVRHAGTPGKVFLDAIGRPFLTLSDNGPDPATPNGKHRLFAARTELDIEGNPRAVRDGVALALDAAGNATSDPLGRVVMRYDYDMLGRRLHQASMEAGQRWVLADVAGNPIRTWDSRGHAFRVDYDPQRRPLRTYVAGLDPANPVREMLTERLVYGEQHPEATARNLRQRLYLHLDQAGAVASEAHDFKGNPTRATRRVTAGATYRAAVDWRGVDEDHVALPVSATARFDASALAASLAPRLARETYESRTVHDALSRAIQVIAPHGNGPAARLNIMQARYNEANFLERLSAWLGVAAAPADLLDPASASVEAVRNIDYDAKGRRTRIEYGAGAAPGRAGVSTAYVYDRFSDRLTDLITERSAAAFPGESALQNLHYTYDATGNVTHIRDSAQQTIYFSNRRVEPGARYTYDALHRLIEATGREHLGQSGAARFPVPHSYNDAGRTGLGAAGSFAPTDGMAMGTYTERYTYDEADNFLGMQHQGDDPAHPGWNRVYTYAETSLIEDGAAGRPRKSSNRLSGAKVGSEPDERHGYDEHGNIVSMPQLQVMQWDYLDQLRMTQRQRVNAEDADGNARHGERTFYVYDAAGERVRKVTERPDGSLKDERLYLGGVEIYRRHAGTHQGLVRETLHLMDDQQRIALVETRNEIADGTPRQLIRYQFSNHLGSASLELDDTAQIISYEEYTPYGSTSFQAVRGQTETKRYRFTGKERDDESGLEYHGARYYAPWLGRWMSCDPMEIGDGLNVYQYAHNCPVMVIDLAGTEGTRVTISGVTPTMTEKEVTALAAKSGWTVSGYLGQDMTGTPYFRHGVRMTPKEREVQEFRDLVAATFKYKGPAIGAGQPERENAVRIESGNSSITMSEEDYEAAAFTAGMFGGQKKEEVRIYKSEKLDIDPSDDPEAQAAARGAWHAEKQLEDLSIAQRIFNEVILPALKLSLSNVIMGAAAPPALGENLPHPGMSDSAVLQSHTFYANAVAEIHMAQAGTSKSPFDFRLYIDKGQFIQSFVGREIARNPAASRRFISLGRNFVEEPDIIPRTTAGFRYDFRKRPNFDFFPLNERQRSIHFRRSYGSTMIGIYYYNSRPTVIRVGR